MNRTGHHFSTNDFRMKLAHMRPKEHPINYRIYALMGTPASSCTIRRGWKPIRLIPGALPRITPARKITITWRWSMWLSVTVKVDRKDAKRQVRAIDGGLVITTERANVTFRLLGLPYQPTCLHKSAAGAALVTQVRYGTATAPTTVSAIRGLVR